MNTYEYIVGILALTLAFGAIVFLNMMGAYHSPVVFSHFTTTLPTEENDTTTEQHLEPLATPTTTTPITTKPPVSYQVTDALSHVAGKNTTYKFVPSWTASLSNRSVCNHGTLVLVNGHDVCTRSRGGEEQRNYTTWFENQTAYNTSQGLPTIYNQTMPYFTYYQDNCTNVTYPYSWDGIAFIVNTTHPLTCEQIKAWERNAMMNGGLAE